MFQLAIARTYAPARSHPEEGKVFLYLTHFLVLTPLPIRYNGFVGVISPYGKFHAIELRRFRE